jgi:hypothetical protein
MRGVVAGIPDHIVQAIPAARTIEADYKPCAFPSFRKELEFCDRQRLVQARNGGPDRRAATFIASWLWRLVPTSSIETFALTDTMSQAADGPERNRGQANQPATKVISDDWFAKIVQPPKSRDEAPGRSRRTIRAEARRAHPQIVKRQAREPGDNFASHSMIIERRVRQNEGIIDRDLGSTLTIKRSPEPQAGISIHSEPRALAALPKEVAWCKHSVNAMLPGKPGHLTDDVGRSALAKMYRPQRFSIVDREPRGTTRVGAALGRHGKFGCLRIEHDFRAIRAEGLNQLPLITQPRCVNDNPLRRQSSLRVQVSEQEMPSVSDPQEVCHGLGGYSEGENLRGHLRTSPPDAFAFHIHYRMKRK